ncbi:hypothetical protein FIU97_05950 [Roseivivax sp. THAF40]|uniref:hypothetical protein n=1 Tax=unclassified Roseivivax TaxID=2639302 RepID=UPI0012696461|nr:MULTISPECIES: hypothetical protein [unclassified Roseivivax]QFS82323.1 hypothetical protein FIV09_05740 [Roseivivax sp. THAF197b]QFT46114.1 hypothetical protein FIU97_05950 [Roseivivax sp. THAF40]
MSAPDTNVKNEEKKHRHSLLGIKASLAYGVGLLAIFTIYVITASNEGETGVAGADTAGSSMVEGETEGTALEGYEAEGYEPGGNSTGSVTLESE